MEAVILRPDAIWDKFDVFTEGFMEKQKSCSVSQNFLCQSFWIGSMFGSDGEEDKIYEMIL